MGFGNARGHAKVLEQGIGPNRFCLRHLLLCLVCAAQMQRRLNTSEQHAKHCLLGFTGITRSRVMYMLKRVEKLYFHDLGIGYISTPKQSPFHELLDVFVILPSPQKVHDI